MCRFLRHRRGKCPAKETKCKSTLQIWNKNSNTNEVIFEACTSHSEKTGPMCIFCKSPHPYHIWTLVAHLEKSVIAVPVNPSLIALHWRFIHDDDEVFKLCTVKSVDTSSTEHTVSCFDEAYQTATVPAKDAYPANPDNHRAVADNTELMYLHDAALLHNVRERYDKDLIYTYTAYILIAVNPYKSIDIYGHDAIENYAKSSIGSLPPHVYGIANRAYRSLRASKRSQVIIFAVSYSCMYLLCSSLSKHSEGTEEFCI